MTIAANNPDHLRIERPPWVPLASHFHLIMPAVAGERHCCETISEPFTLLPDRQLLLGGERRHGGFELGHEGVVGLLAVERPADAYRAVERHQQRRAFGQRLAEPVHEDRNDRDLRARAGQMSDAFLEM